MPLWSRTCHLHKPCAIVLLVDRRSNRYIASLLSSSPEPVCTWNDAVDKEFDKKVARGCVRPIARGAVTPFQAYPWATLKTVAIVAILFRLPATCMFFVFLSTIYPFAKRVTYYPQFVLGSIFSLAFFTSVRGMDVDPLSKDNFAPSLCFFAANTIWTTIYDTIYAHQDVADDVHVGVKSMAVHLRNSSKLLTSFLALFITGLLALAGALAGFGPLYYIPVVGESAMGLGATSTLVKLAEAKSFLNPVGWPEPPNSPYVGVTTRCYWY
ncbi:uncharacterized protein N7443_009431 [Penicillium atrosanguineum]|uniref:uncharacterized protein n=1 Tax=Penicillium atrosanguineum TaxID=1132637 RepID=UPI00239F65A6|nr:uncharacterized protein N7443_009431 [Penicillium atrosanguineum]KAJ5126389.1 UbiA prenyltransferase family-domain-containing protein [Penicillium atrosanguineum]KAJ5293478.1 hypothetical protein N7443_009431 [Penicillium atrosanguineum]